MNSLKRAFIILFFFLFLGIGIFHPLPIHAHNLQIDGTIGGTLHVDPDDDPFAQQISTLYLYFKDETNKFTLTKCSCTAHILENGKELFLTPLTAGTDPLTAIFTYTFPKMDVYTLEVEGKPINPESFQLFKLTYIIRVDRIGSVPSKTTTSSPFSTYMGYLLIAGIVIIFLGAYFFYSKFILKKQQ